MKKRITAMALLLAMLLSLLPANAVAVEEPTPTEAAAAVTEPVQETAPAETEAATAPQLAADHTHNCSHCGDAAPQGGWTAWPEGGTPSAAGHYYLTGDVTLSKTWSISKDITLCLAGHTLSAGSLTTRMISIGAGGRLSITDCTDTGKLQGSSACTSNGGIILVNRSTTAGTVGGELRLYGGTLTGASSSSANGGGAIYVQGTNDSDVAPGTFYMYGGTVTGNRTTHASGSGGGVFISGPTGKGTKGAVFQMTGGSITNNTSGASGGGIFAGPSAQLTIKNATVSGNTATADGGGMYVDKNALLNISGSALTGNTAGKEGGAIRFGVGAAANISNTEVSGNTSATGALRTANDTVLTVTGGSIKDNTAQNAAALEILGTAKVTLDGVTVTGNHSTSNTGYGAVDLGNANAALILTGATRITGNTGKSGQGMNLFLRKPGDNGLVSYVQVDDLAQGASVGITLMADRTQMEFSTEIAEGKDPLAYCFSDNAAYEVVRSGSRLALGPATTHEHCLKNCAVCDDAKTSFTKWTDATGLPTEAGAYFLDTDVTLSGLWEVKADIILCLNGHTVTQGEAESRVITLSAGVLTITDCQTTGKIAGAKGVTGVGGIINVYKGTEFNLCAGTLTGAATTSNGGAVYLRDGTAEAPGGTFHMYGGTIEGNAANQGGAVYVREYAVLDIQGGSIKNNTATTQGGAVRVALNSKTVIGAATLTGNTAPSGSALYIGGNNAAVTLDGTVITGNPVTDGGAVAKTNGTLILKGATRILDNKKADGSQMNLYLSGQNTIAPPALTEGAGIGVSIGQSRESLVFSATVTGDPSAYFTSDSDDYTVGLQDSKLVLQPKVVYSHIHCLSGCQSCGHKAVSFQAWTNAAALPTAAGAYSLETDVTLSGPWAVGKDIILCLNGHTITQGKDDSRVITLSAGKLSLTDCQNSGKVVGAKSVTSVGGIINVYKGAVFNLYAGTLTGAVTTSSGGAVYLRDGTAEAVGGTMNMYGGTITGNTAKTGGAVATNVYAVVNIQGGAITDNTATDQAGAISVNNNCTVTVANAAITGNTAADTGAIYAGGSNSSVTLTDVTVTGSTSQKNGAVTIGNNTAKLEISGKSVISDNTSANLYLLSGGAKAADLNGLAEGAKIGVTLSKTRIYAGDMHFSTELTQGVDPSGFCFSDDPVYGVAILANRLVLKRLPQSDDHIHCLHGCEGACGHEKFTFIKLEESAVLPTAGCYYLTGDVKLEAAITVESQLRLCLCGHMLQQTKGRMFHINGLLSVSDCTAKGGDDSYKAGVLTGGSNTYGGLVNLRRGGEFGLYDGILADNHAPESVGGAVYIQGATATEPGGVFTMYGGEISGSTAATGGAVATGAGVEGAQPAQIHLLGGTVRGNTATASGGAVYAAEHTQLTLGAVTLKNNTAGKNGGAIAASHTQLLLQDAILEGNTAAASGGGVYLTGGSSTMTVKSGSICKNTARNGGGILLEASSQLTLEAGSICHNTATDDGGGFYASTNTAVTVTGGQVAENAARSGAGAYFLRSTGSLRGGSFTGNAAQKSGGGVYFAGAQATLGAVTLSSNTSGESGAGMMAANTRANDTLYCSAVTVDGAVMADNKATASGGGFCISGQGTKCTVESVTVSGNSAGVSGGGVFLYRSEADLRGGTIENNTSTKGGGGIFCQGAQAALGQDLTLRKNTAGGNGGGVSAARATVTTDGKEENYPSTVTVRGTQILSNTAKGNGGGLYVSGSGTQVTLEGPSISKNNATHGGGVIVEGKAKLTFKSGSVSSNTAKTAGGGMYISTNSSLAMSGGSVSGNTSRGGGGIYFLRSSGILSGGSVSSNAATKTHGGGIYVTGATVTLCGVHISNNTAKGNGGGVVTASTTDKSTGIVYYPTLTMSGGKITGNSAVHGAGVLSQSQKGVFTMTGGEISYNKGTGNGAGIYSSTNTTFRMEGGTVAYNEGRYGAGIYHNKATATYTGGEVHHNTAEVNGGGMSITAVCTVDMENVSIHDNQANHGGAMILQSTGTVVTAKNCQIYGNTARTAGGGCYVSSNVVASYTDCSFRENISQGSAGGLFTAATATVTVTGGSFTDNKALGNGGGLQTRGTLYLTDTILEGNSAGENGGGIAGGKMGATGMGIVPGLMAANVVVRNNQAAAQGGGVYLALGSKAELSGAVITDNTAGGEGGGLWAVDDTLLEDVTVTGNAAGGEGYGVYLAGSEYDGHSYFIGLLKLRGNIRVENNPNGDLYLGEKSTLVVDSQGLGQDTLFHITLDSGLLTQRLYGAYNYEGGDCRYTVTYGDRSLTDPEIPAAEETQPTETQPGNTEPGTQGGSGLLIPVICGAGVLAAAAVILLILRSKKKGKEA